VTPSEKRAAGWSYFGEQVDAMDADDQRFMWETCRDPGESFEDWMVSLYRGPKRAGQLELFP